MAFCASCGAPREAGATFCGHCGRSFLEGAPGAMGGADAGHAPPRIDPAPAGPPDYAQGYAAPRIDGGGSMPPPLPPPPMPPHMPHLGHAGWSAPRTPGVAIASLVLGIVSLCLAWIPFINFAAVAMGVLGIVLGAMGMKQIDAQPHALTGKGLAIAGLVCSIIAVAIAMLVWIVLFGA